MKRLLQHEGRGRQIACAEETAYLELIRSADMLSRGVSHLLKAEDLSATQYNVLRILRGAKQGLACGEIGNRMITRDPDITRLLDRLEKRALIERCRDTKDRRMVTAKITPGGADVLGRMDAPVREMHRKQLAHLGKGRIAMLTGLLREARGEAA